MQQMTYVMFRKLLYGGFILGESESVYNCVFPNSFLIKLFHRQVNSLFYLHIVAFIINSLMYSLLI